MADTGIDDDMRKLFKEKGYDIIDEQVEGEEIIYDSDDENTNPLANMLAGMSGPENNLSMEELKEKGNQAFKEGKYKLAIAYYNKGQKVIYSAVCKGPEALKDQNLSDYDFHFTLNTAMCNMKLERYDLAASNCEKALHRRGNLGQAQLVKALYRKADAEKHLGRLEDCLETLKELFEVEPENAAAKAIHQVVDREYKKQVAARNKNFKNMFAAYEKETVELENKEKEAFSKMKAELGLEFEETETKLTIRRFNRNQWGVCFIETILYSITKFHKEASEIESPIIKPDMKDFTIWFLGASSSFELRFLTNAMEWFDRLPSRIRNVRIVLMGFLGEVGPQNKQIPDENEPEDGIFKEETLEDGRTFKLECYKGKAEVIIANEDLSLERPDYCVIPHPGFNRYFSDFYKPIQYLIKEKIPTCVCGRSAPDTSEKEGTEILHAYKANIKVPLTKNPHKISLIENSDLSKLHHFWVFEGGLGIGQELFFKVKLDLLSRDLNVL